MRGFSKGPKKDDERREATSYPVGRDSRVHGSAIGWAKECLVRVSTNTALVALRNFPADAAAVAVLVYFRVFFFFFLIVPCGDIQFGLPSPRSPYSLSSSPFTLLQEIGYLFHR